MSVPRVWKLELPPGVIMAMLEVFVVHASEPDLVGDGLGVRHIRNKAGLSGGLGGYVPGGRGHWVEGEPTHPSCLGVSQSAYLVVIIIIYKGSVKTTVLVRVAAITYSIGTERMVKRVSPWDQNLEEG
ncbi:hypothetical protein DFH94DRAFT_684313 [Russula ochroleuca]|uniref:Uncharacterized protein n=1 Tax=Russula ochroleuca TaxID=152965 RepID=A0A9P5K1I7_9AGAM|nr:hypothetical protein DFH94DRAFT_684313 [Russula ochroleuca]